MVRCKIITCICTCINNALCNDGTIFSETIFEFVGGRFCIVLSEGSDFTVHCLSVLNQYHRRCYLSSLYSNMRGGGRKRKKGEGERESACVRACE